MGRKSSIKGLPPHVVKAIEFELGQDNKTLDDLVAWLADEHGYEISRSSLHRYAQREAKTREALKRQREVTAAFAKELGPDAVDGKQGRLLVEMFNGLVFDLISSKMAAGDDEEEAAGFDTKDFMMLGRALKDVAQANRFSQDFETKLREQIRAEERAKAAAAIDEAVSEAAKRGEKGFSGATIDAIKSTVLGVEPPRKAEGGDG